MEKVPSHVMVEDGDKLQVPTEENGDVQGVARFGGHAHGPYG